VQNSIRLFLATFMLTLTLLAAGCSRCDGGVPIEADDTFPRDTLVIAQGADVTSLMSVLPQSGADTEVLAAISSLLLQPEFDCGLSFEPLVAREWSFSEDGTALEMTLAEGFTWSDGTPVTAHDVAFTYDLIADPAVASPRGDFIEHMLPDARPEVIDDTHLRFRFDEAYDRTTMISHAVGVELLPHHVLGDAPRDGLAGHAYHDAPVTNGPFALESRKREQQVVLAPSEHWGGPEAMRPKLARVVHRVLPDYSTQLLELEAGSVDLVPKVEVADADRLAREHPEIALYRRGWRAMEYVGWNQVDPDSYGALQAQMPEGETADAAGAAHHPLFGDARVRAALSRAIDADGMMAALFHSDATGETYARRAVGTISPSLCHAHNDEIEPLAHDPGAAAAELAALGWADTDGDRILDKGGRPFRFRLMIPSGNDRREREAVLIQAALQDVGVAVDIDPVEFGTWVDRAIRHDFDALLGAWSIWVFIDPTAKWHSGPDYPYNFIAYDNPRVDELIEQGLAAQDPQEAIATWHEFQRVVHDDQPYTFLYWIDEIVAVHGRFQDVQVDVLSPYSHLWEWWVKADEVKYEH